LLLLSSTFGRLVVSFYNSVAKGDGDVSTMPMALIIVMIILFCVRDGRGLCLLILHLLGGLGYKINSSKHWFILVIQRVLMTLSVLTFFSGVRIEVGEFCNSLTEVPCC